MKTIPNPWNKFQLIYVLLWTLYSSHDRVSVQEILSQIITYAIGIASKKVFLCHWYIVGILCIKIKLDYNLLSFELRKHFKCIFQLFRFLTIGHPPRNITFRSTLEIIDSMNDSQNKSFYVANNSSNKSDAYTLICTFDL